MSFSTTRFPVVRDGIYPPRPACNLLPSKAINTLGGSKRDALLASQRRVVRYECVCSSVNRMTTRPQLRPQLRLNQSQKERKILRDAYLHCAKARPKSPGTGTIPKSSNGTNRIISLILQLRQVRTFAFSSSRSHL